MTYRATFYGRAGDRRDITCRALIECVGGKIRRTGSEAVIADRFYVFDLADDLLPDLEPACNQANIKVELLNE